MSSKKNKNKSKQNKQNPNIITQITEISSSELENIGPEEKLVEIPGVILKSDERVPEIKNPTDMQSAIENKDIEGDTPKKPKRNRGKKKKSDKEGDFDTDKEEKTMEEMSVKENEAVEVKSEQIPIKEKAPDMPTAPNARKKRNKKGDKNDDDEKVTFICSADHPLKVTHLTKSEADNIMADVKMITCVPIASEKSDQEDKKKKNKKKKRTDSEKSEKEELLCTAAFQKILEPREDKKGSKKVEGKEEDETKESQLATTQTIKEVTQKVSLEMILKETLETKTTPLQDTVEERNKPFGKEDDNKNKKKNKKDKKHPPKSGSEHELIKTPEPKIEEVLETPIVTSEASADIIPATSITEKYTENILPKIEQSKSPKLKAKIAKPVERKTKDTFDAQPTETPQETIVPTSTLLVDEKDISKEKSNQNPGSKLTEISDSKIIGIKEESEDYAQKEQKQFKENIEMPGDVKPKKRKKSPKPQKSIEELKADIEVKSCVESQSEKIEIIEMPSLMPITEVDEIQKETFEKKSVEENKETKVCQTNIDTVKPVEFASEATLEKQPVDIKLKAIPLPFTSIERLRSREDPNIDVPVLKYVTDQASSQDVTEKLKEKEADVETSQRIPTPDSGMGKKRRKSPKPKHDVAQGTKTPEKMTSESRKPETETKDPDKESLEAKKDVQEVLETGNTHPTPANLSIFKGETVAKPEDKTELGASKKTEDSKKDKSTVHKSDDIPKVELIIKDTEITDIEVSSVKTEETLSSLSDIGPAPEIDHPRSSSQSADGNNNMFIREIVGEESMPSAIVTRKVDTPNIQSPVDTLVVESQTSTKLLKENNQIKSNKEKTDLKSKMMEVNQDMEGLRKSIEKSLAELSAIEKTEKGTEQQFIEAQSKLEQIKNMAIIQHANIKENITKTAEDNNDKIKLESNDKKIVDSETTTTKIEPIASKTSIPTASKKLEEEGSQVAVSKTPEPPARKDNKGKGKSKKKGKYETEQTSGQISSSTTTRDIKSSTQETKPDEKPEQKTIKTDEKGKQQASSTTDADMTENKYSMNKSQTESEQFEPIENFDDALTSSVDDVNKNFEIIASDAKNEQNNPEINITAPTEESDEKDKNKKDKQSKINPVSQPKNLIGHPAIPARSNKMDYKKEKNKTPNSQQAKVKLKDVVSIEKDKKSKDTQTENRKIIKDKSGNDTVSCSMNENEEYIYKYSFRRVYLPNACHVCKMDLKKDRVPCHFCNLVFYCSLMHKDQDSVKHDAFCFAVSTIIRLKDQKHIYEKTSHITGHDYRLLRMQMIVSCEKVLKRRLEPCEQEMLLYPRVCADVGCREWRQDLLKDCEGCGQISYCSAHNHHIPPSHQKWCKSYSLYHKLVTYQQIKGRLEPQLPTKVMTGSYQIPDKMNEVLASMYEEKIDMSDIQYAALTQVATAPLTALYCYQLYSQQINGNDANGVQKKSTFTIHVVGAELQFEADALNKWEVFFLHLRPDVSELRIVLIGPDLNPGNLPLDLLSKIKLCVNCLTNKRRVIFDFQDKKNYNEYWATDFIIPDLVCAFNPSIQRSSILNGRDTWPSTIKCIFKQKSPFIITSYTMNELHRDLARIKEFSMDFNVVSEPKFNNFASVRPDRNFISDDEMPLLFKNYCFLVVCGAF